MISLPYLWTKDNLRLQGVHYEPQKKDTCVLFIHGMGGNEIENKFAHEVGEVLSEKEISFIFGHNRGYNHTNNIPTKKVGKDGGYKTVIMGVTYERFKDCIYDIQAWIDYVKEQGYKKIILMGHSLGAPKVIYYLHRNHLENLTGVILCSPGDMVGLAKMSKYQKNYEELLKEAKNNLKNGQPKKLLSDLIWDFYNLSSQTFLDLFSEEGPADNLPILRNPEHFPELESITVPILETVAEHDDIVIRSLEEDLKLLESKALNCPSFTSKIIPGTNHIYDNKGKELGEVIFDWIKPLNNV